MDATTSQVLALDMANLTQEQMDWLHDLKNKAQRINIAMFLKEEGIPSLRKVA